MSVDKTMHLTKEAVLNLEKLQRINLINSISGIKPGNLIGTQSNSGHHNLGIFSSVVHLGSNPGYFGFIMRPSSEVRRDTFENISETGVFTINHVHTDFAQQAHYTAAKFESNISEFEKCGLTAEFLADFKAPFVRESQLKFGLKHVESVPIKSTNTVMIIGELQHLFFPKDAMDDEGMIDLGAIGTAGISGLNSYYELKKMATYPYARVSEVPDFKK